MKNLVVSLAIGLISSIPAIAAHHAPKGKSADQICKEHVQKDAQKIVNDMESKAKAGPDKGRSFSKEKALAEVKKDIYEGCMKSQK